MDSRTGSRNYARERLLRDARCLVDSGSEEVQHRVAQLVQQDNEWRSRCLNLNAAEAVLSPLARRLLVSEGYGRAMIGPLGSKIHKGYKYYDQIEALAIEAAKKLFGCSHVNLRPTTTSSAEGIVIHALTEVGDTILTQEGIWGHGTWNSPIGWNSMRGLKTVDIPFDTREWNIDVEGLRRAATTVKKSPLIIIGTSLPLFPHPCKEVKEVADQIGAKIYYDAAHIMGLMAGGRFQDPLKEGMDLMIGTSNKTFSGPVGGMILTNDQEIQERIDRCLDGHLSSYGHSRMPAMAVTLAEWIKFGKSFAGQMVANAKALGKAMDAQGFDVVAKHKGYTESHIVAVDVNKQGGGNKVADALSEANINVSAWRVWKPEEDFHGLRIGVTEMTRYGMKEGEMSSIAEFMRHVAIDEEDPTEVGKEVAVFRKPFNEVHYCFEKP